jgi:AraC-like DNA-binding protein
MRNPTGLRSHAPQIAATPRPPIGILRCALGDAPEREGRVLLRNFFEPLGIRYEVEPLGDVPFDIDITVQTLPGLMFLAGKMHGSRTTRTRRGSDPTDDVGLMVNLRGPHLVGQRGREIVLGDGEATLVSLTDPLVCTQRPPGDLLVLRFPKARLAPLLTGGPNRFLRLIPCGTPGLGLLADYVAITRDEQKMAAPDLPRLMATHLFDLMTVTLGATRDAAEVAQGRGVRAALLHAIKQDIARNLERPNLSVAALALRHGCTPRFIQRLFESEGTTFTEYVLAQRLVRAHRVLSDPRGAGEKISTVAYDCGFGDVSYFNRLFRQRYGAAPSDVREKARRDASGKLM